MPTITINGEVKSFPKNLSVAELLQQLGKDAKKLAVEVNRELVSRTQRARAVLKDGDAVEIVTLVGGGSNLALDPPSDKPLKVGKFTFRSRLFTGTGKYTLDELMQQCMDASGCDDRPSRGCAPRAPLRSTRTAKASESNT